MAKNPRFDRLKIFVRTLAMSGRVTQSNGNGWPRRWWERALAAVLVLIAIVVAILLYVVVYNWCNWYPQSASCIGNQPPNWAPPHVIDVAVRRLTTYSSTGETYDLPAGINHERYMWYQPKYGQLPTYLFVAVLTDPGFGPPREFLQVCKRYPEPNFSCSPVACAGPIALQDTSSNSSYPGQQPGIWGYYCVIAPPQPQTSNYTPGTYWGAFRVMLSNSSQQPSLRYTYVSNCDARYPRGDRCVEDDVPPPGQPGYTPPSAGYPTPPPSGGYTPPYPSTPGTPMSSPSTGGTGGH